KKKMNNILSSTPVRIAAGLVLVGILVVLVLAVVGVFTQPAAVVNGERISRAEFNQAVATTEAQYQQEMTSEEKSLLLDQMITQKLVLQDARARGITATDEEIEAEYQTLLVQFGGSEKDLAAMLQEYGTNLREVRTQI